MADIFGKKRIAELEEQVRDYTARIEILVGIGESATHQLQQIKSDYVTLSNQCSAETKKVAEEQTARQTVERKVGELEARLTQIPNRERTTLKAIEDLAGNRSNEGYDVFLKEIH